MVQLNTIYDKTLKEKIFVLKGEEGYARTTDVLVDIISDYNDCNTHINHARVGLEVDVLREVGNGFINIYDNNELIFETIPWSHENMDLVINSEWNSKGVYWIDNKLVIGNDIDSATGLFLAYDVEHNLSVKYTGNKQCLGSKSEILSFEMTAPEAYTSTITATPSSTSLDTGSDVTFTVNLQTAEAEMTKSIKVFDGDILLDIIDISPDTDATYTTPTLSDGLHTIRFNFDGDEESLSSQTTQQVSIGHVVTITDKPSFLIYGEYGSVSVHVEDYFGNPPARNSVIISSDNSWEPLSQPVILDSEGNATVNPVWIGEDEWYALYSQSKSAKYLTPIYKTVSTEITADRTLISTNLISKIEGVVTGSTDSETVPIVGKSIILHPFEDEIELDENGKFVYYINGSGVGDIDIYSTLSTPNESYDSNHVSIEDVFQYWSISGSINENRKGVSTKVSNGYKLALSSSTGNYVSAYAEQSELYTGNWSIEFDVISKTNGLQFGVSYKRRSGVEGGSVRSSMNLNANSKVKCTFINKVLRLYVNGSQVTSMDSSSYVDPQGVPVIGIVGNSNTSMIFNNVKIKRL